MTSSWHLSWNEWYWISLCFFILKFVLFNHIVLFFLSYSLSVFLLNYAAELQELHHFYSCLLRIYLMPCKFFSYFFLRMLVTCTFRFLHTLIADSSLCSRCYSFKFFLLVFAPLQYLFKYVSIIHLNQHNCYLNY